MSDASKLTVNIAPAAYANDVSISASGSFSIEVDVNQVSNRVLDRTHSLTRPILGTSNLHGRMYIV
ncbi:hypothetical protein GYMLUDRAFT_402260 [Collybiopsis luxurians FD-317 M1]|nr:hypothetical protein GYMLUDRAFT_402260 [Collybiopsis luxurians FD-317 M1]